MVTIIFFILIILVVLNTGIIVDRINKTNKLLESIDKKLKGGKKE